MDLNQLTSHIQKRKRDCQERVGSGVGAAVGESDVALVAVSIPVDWAAGEATLAAVSALEAAEDMSASEAVSTTAWSTKNLMFSLFWAKSTV